MPFSVSLFSVAPFYEQEIWLKNHVEALFKPSMGKFYDKKAPGYSRNDTNNRVIELEMRNAVQKHHDREARVIPIILRPCMWEDKPLLTDLQVLPQKNEKPIKPIGSWSPNKRDEIYKEVALAIKAAIEEWARVH